MPNHSSWLTLLKQFKGTVLDAFKTRLELLCLEWQEEKKRFFYVCLFMVGASVAFFLFLFTLTAAIIISTWETDYRYWAVWGICLFYGLTSGVLVGLIIKQVCCALPPFKATLEELRKDCEWLDSQN